MNTKLQLSKAILILSYFVPLYVSLNLWYKTDFVVSLNIAFFYNGNVSVSKDAKIASLICKLLCNFPTYDCHNTFHFPYCSHIRTQLKEQNSLNMHNTLDFHWLLTLRKLKTHLLIINCARESHQIPFFPVRLVLCKLNVVLFCLLIHSVTQCSQ
jgi:hypothetical protein